MTFITHIRDRLRRAPFITNVLTMLSGTAIAQVIPIAVAPILTRLYSAEDYGAYALFLLISYTISALASLRYEFAIMLPEEEADAASLVALCFGLALLVSSIVLTGTVVIRVAGLDVPRASALGLSVYLLAPMVLLQSTYQTLSYWLLRKQAFRQLALSRVFRAVAMAGANIALGIAHAPQGLVISSLLGQTAAVFVLVYRLFREDKAAFKEISRPRALRQAALHKNFPIFALPSDLLSTFAQQLPLLLLPQRLGGYFAFVQNVVNAPLGFIGGAVLDAFKERATRDYRERGEFRAVFVKLFQALALATIIPTLVLMLFAPALFAFVFGEAWREGGNLAQILGLLFCFKFIASPLSYSYFVVGRAKEDFFLHVWIVASSAAVLAYGLNVKNSPTAALWAFSINYALVYVVYLIRSYRFSLGQPGAYKT